MEWISNSGTIEAVMAYVEDETELGAFDADGTPIDPEDLEWDDDEGQRPGESAMEYFNRIMVDDFLIREQAENNGLG